MLNRRTVAILTWKRKLGQTCEQKPKLKSQVGFPLLRSLEFRGTGVNIGVMGQRRLENKAVVQQFLNETVASLGPLSREVTTHILAESV